MLFRSNIGTNPIWAEYAGLSDASIASVRDYLTVDDMGAVQQQVPGIQSASPVLNLHQFFSSGGGKSRDVLILGVNPEYADIRRLVLVAGRFFDQQDSITHSHAAVVTERFAQIQFGSPEDAVGRTIALSGVPFVVTGVFRGEDARSVHLMTAEGKPVDIPKDTIEDRKRGPSEIGRAHV